MWELPDGSVVYGDGPPGPKEKLADSIKEYNRRLELLAEFRAGLLTSLRFQREFNLYGKGGTLIATYVADFVYIRDGVRVVEDVKPMRPYKVTRAGVKDWARDADGNKLLRPFATRDYFLKKRLMLDNYGITVQEF